MPLWDGLVHDRHEERVSAVLVEGQGQWGEPGDDGSRSWEPEDEAVDRAKRLIRQAVSDQGRWFDKAAIAAWFAANAPDVRRDLVDGLITAATVNDPHRRHYPEPQDLMYVEADGRYRRYDPSGDGTWTRVGLPRPGAHPGLSTLLLTAGLIGG